MVQYFVQPPPNEIRCGYFALGHEIEAGLANAFNLGGRQLIILVDAPFGFAMKELTKVERSHSIVVTDSPCPEYWEDLWEMGPQVLLVGGTLLAQIQDALEQAARGESFKRTPAAQSQLSISERKILRLCAAGLDTDAIALKLDIKRHTARNYLSQIFEKLSLTSRVEISLYYWGMWHWLEAYESKTNMYVNSFF